MTFFDGIRTERHLMQLSADRLSVRWFVGYNLDEPLPDFDKRTPVYGKQAFRYNQERDIYICPNNAILPLHTHAYNEREKRYQGDAGTCNACSNVALMRSTSS